jgi:uncharacterized protein (DUF1800 family)
MSHSAFFGRAFYLSLTSCLLCFAPTSTKAIVDLNNDGFDDIWQLFYRVPTLTPNGNADIDGQADIVWQNTTTGSRSIWLMRGMTFVGSVNLATLSMTWNIAGFGDFNGDGNTDIVLQNRTTGTRVLWLMRGTTILATPSLGTVSPQWNIAAVGDFNRDGKPDLLWQNSATGACTIWFMNGTGYSSSAPVPSLPPSWKVMGTGDFDGDGKSDILWQNNASGARVIWLMNAAALVRGITIGVLPAQWNIAGIGDFNGDGKPDILFQDTATVARQVWLMNNTVRTSIVNLTNVARPWQVAGVGTFGGDGLSNLQESLAGTDPFDARSGLRITQTTFGAGTVTLRWPSILGKQYQVFVSTTGAPNSWQPLGALFNGTGSEITAMFNVTAAQKYFRVVASDVDTDGDGLSDWEELKVGLDPTLVATDGTNNDYQRIVAALQATTSTLTLTENDPVWTSDGVTSGTFTITRTGRLDPLTINLTFSGSAVAGTDYQTVAQTVSLHFGMNSVIVHIAPLSGAVSSLGLQIAVGANYQVGAPSNATMNLASPQSNAADAARLLTQATFGPTTSLLSHVQVVGLTSFLSEQFNIPTTLTLPRVDAAIIALPDDQGPSNSMFQEAWWHTIITAPDQLRQRVAFALSEIFVASSLGNEIGNYPDGVATYWDMLANDAFGNFRQLLEDVTLNPMMGDYLDMVHNDKPRPELNTEPNENYAREVMQLFTIGLYKLNPDGTRQLDNQNEPIPTYDQDVVEGFAHVFTGWYWAQSGTPHWSWAEPNYRQPMQAFPNHHDTGAKLLLDGVTLPAGRSQTQDLEDALDLLFNHPNVGPFVCRELIQRLVTSNPSPAYVGRVAAVFANNGMGVRGDLKAVIQAILLDTEARSAAGISSPSYGHQREPIVRLANLYRAFNAQASTGKYIVNNVQLNYGQAPLLSPSVFNFFSPNYLQPGAIAQAGVFSPEFQITTDTTVVTTANSMRSNTYRVPGDNPDSIILNLTPVSQLSSSPSTLVNSLNNLLMSGQMSSAVRDIVVDAVTQMPASSPLERAQTAVHLLVISPEFVIEK